MRPIKFRAWNKEDKRFEYTEDQGFDRLASWLRSDLYEVEQYTGLLDKNGKEIYEGDILSTAKAGPVIWETDCYVCGGKYELSLRAEAHFGEVIGNIYENGELLE